MYQSIHRNRERKSHPDVAPGNESGGKRIEHARIADESRTGPSLAIAPVAEMTPVYWTRSVTQTQLFMRGNTDKLGWAEKNVNPKCGDSQG
jgi:hypothetical protein